MSSRKNKPRFWPQDTNKQEPINSSNVGRKLLEKMGWQDGLGLGRDNQGMIENPMWKHRRDADCKLGFKSKEERVTKEVLAHQNAFEDLLGELNAQNSEENCESVHPLANTSRDTVQVSKRQIRYIKMAQAKDISNYSIKDFHGIIGKDVTKKNLSLLREVKEDSTATYDLESERSMVYKSQNEKIHQIDQHLTSSVQKIKCKLDAFDETETSESSSYMNNGVKYSSPDPVLRKKRKSKNLLDKFSSKNDDISAQCIQNRDGPVTAGRSNLEEVEMMPKQTKRRKIMKKDLEINNSTDSDLNSSYSDLKMIGEDVDLSASSGNLKSKSKICQDYSSKDRDYFEEEKPKRKSRKEKLKNNNKRNISNNTLCSDLNMERSSISFHSQNLKSLSEIRQEKENSTKDSVCYKRKLHKQSSLEKKSVICDPDCSDSNATSNFSNEDGDHAVLLEESDGVELEQEISQRNSRSCVDRGFDQRELCEKLSQDADILAEISQAFIGSNLDAIKGYGNY